MKRFSKFFTCFFLISLISGLTSCKKNPPVLQRDRTEKIQQVCDALQNQKNAEALRIIQGSAQLKNSPLASHLQNQERDRKLLQQLNQALLRQQYSRALNMIQEAEQNGQASSELLQLKELPYALQALQLFCVRMPWEDADSLQKNWNVLKPHERLLSGSPAFRTFRQEQFNLLRSFHQEADREYTALLMARIDGFLAGGRPDSAWRLVRTLRKTRPEHEFSRLAGTPDRVSQELVAMLERRGIQPGGSSASLELAAALAWPRLSSRQKRTAGEILAGLQKKETISGTILAAVHLNTASALLGALKNWRKAAGPDQQLPPDFQLALLNTFSRQGDFPGIPPVLDLLRSGSGL